MIKIDEIESIPPKENPFLHDLVNMGTRLGTNLMVMYENFEDQKAPFLIVVNMETGERVRLVF
jgi:hypothetical protein